ncbi:GNAT family N-acetyltransferase [Bacillus shivajii]|uniref:GNAT family N-acetyltransferase n=1 Tax=Bacillus shivajii TaxID=1983719 RepID=UPI001CF9D57E|nr:GNAT family N-acetyltransferase [Bacillus shivajii]UCZ54238.1 GNAT family N-acetyltransferase [Bacillus shivajii]
MDIKEYSSPKEVLQQVETCLLKNEAENNLPLGLLNRLKKEEDKNVSYEVTKQPFVAVGKKEDGTTGIVLLQTPPYNLVICGDVDYAKEAAKWVYNKNQYIPGVVGAKPLVEEFVNGWKELTNCKSKTFMKQKIYRLDQVNDIPRQKGRLCYATEDDIALVTYWTEKFYEEALEPINKEEAKLFVINKIKQNQIFIWRNENGCPVSMAARSRESKNGVVISLVYTPEEYKKQGYATTCVAALSDWLLQEGYQFCSLYTDLENQTSNNIYMKVGYEPIADSVEYHFKY